MKTDIRTQMNAEKPDDVLADLERKHRSLQQVVGCDEKAKLLETLEATVKASYQRNRRRDGYCHACGMMTSQCNCWDSVNGGD